MANEGTEKVERAVVIPEHLWNALELMSREMGSERDALIAQAVFNFARMNGYLVPGAAQKKGKGGNKREESKKEKRESSRKVIPEPPLPDALARKISDDESTVHPPRGDVDDSMLGEGFSFEEPVTSVGAPLHLEPPGPKLYLVGQDGELGRVDKERFIIGRGKHCDLVLHSSKVSREHAAIVHEPPQFFLEDLGSSNGTWFHKKRISRKKIEDGDEFFICSEKIKCVLRS